MKFRAPAHISGPLSHNGTFYEIGQDLSVDAPESEADALAAHGFIPLPHAPMTSLETGEEDECMGDADACDGERLEELSPEAGGEGQEETGRAEEERIEAMTRAELFAHLKAKGVKAAPPVRNEQLRSLARAALLARLRAAP